MSNSSMLIACVGAQHVAVAVFLESWRQAFGDPQAVLLLATGATTRSAEAIATNFWPDRTCVREIGMSTSGPTAPHVIVDAVLRAADSPVSSVLFVNAGLAFHVASIAAQLPPEARFVEGSTTGFQIFSPGHDGVGQSFRSADLGLERVLQMHDLSLEIQPVRSGHLPGWMARPGGCAGSAVRLRLPDGRSFPVDLAFERGGWVYLAMAAGEGDEALTQLRQAALLREGIGTLRFRMAILAHSRRDDALRERARRLTLDLIDSAPALQRWKDGGAADPHPAAVLWPPELNGECQGKGGEPGRTLVTHVGRDVSATVSALSAHRPESAVLLVDQDSWHAVDAAVRITKMHSCLPVSRVRFVRTDRLGCGASHALETVSDPGGLCADVTPGTNAQGVALARVVRTEQLWSIDLRNAVARQLFADGTRPLEPMSVVVQGNIVGGTLLDEGKEENPHHRPFFCEVGRCLASGRDHELRVSGNRARVPSGSGAPLSGPWRTRNNGYLEDIIAACFAAAGATDVRVGMKWRWPPSIEDHLHRSITGPKPVPTAMAMALSEAMNATDQSSIAAPRRHVHSDETDVALRWKHYFVVVEAKSGRAPDRRALGRMCRQVEGVALKFGRLAVPIVVLQHPPQNGLPPPPSGLGAIVMLLADIVCPKTLTRTLDEAIDARRVSRRKAPTRADAVVRPVSGA